jgi:CheY-like chemotaxis protein
MAKILLVEDNEMNRDMLARRLNRKGYKVVVAGDGREAVAVALAQSVDLILMDLSLPVLDGWEATRLLKSHSQTGSIPVVALTAHAMPGDRELALAAGCDDFDTKPVDFLRLIAKIETQLARPLTPGIAERAVNNKTSTDESD